MPTWIWIFFIFAGGLFAFKVSYVLSTALALPVTQGALYVSTSRVRVAAVLDALSMKSGQLLFDIGCGDGRVLRMASRRFGIQAVGYEVNWLAYIKARLLCMGDRNIHIRRKNFWKENLSAADVVFCYLYPDVMKRLAKKLESDLRPGTVVVSCNFALPGFTPSKVFCPEGSLHNDPLYLYKM